MCVFLCMGGNSTTWMNTAVLVTCMRNFPKNRGPVSGILKGYVGLSTAIFTDICTALFASNPSTLVLILALIPLLVCLFATFFLHETEPSTLSPAELEQESQFLNIFNTISVVLALYLLAFDVSGSHGHLLSSIFAAGLLILLASPAGVPLFFILFKRRSSSDIEQPIKEPLLVAQKTEEPELQLPILAAVLKRRPLIGEDHTILQVIQTFDFWVLFLSFLCGAGSGMFMMNNLGQIGLALGYSDVAIFVSLTSIWGFFGRIISGLLSEYYIR